MTAAFKGKRNIYLCEDCGHGFVSIDRDDGVTPFMTKCLNADCGKMASSLFYACPQPMLAGTSPALEWYRPGEPEIAGLSPSVADHVRKGGLLSRVVRP